MDRNITEILNDKYNHFINDDVYLQLEKLARHCLNKIPKGGTLLTGDVINEAVIKVYKQKKKKFKSRGHFYSLMSTIMRNLIIDHGRKKMSKINGGDKFRVTLSQVDLDGHGTIENLTQLLSIENAIKELGAIDKVLEEMIVMHYYGGVSVNVISEYFDMSVSTVKRRLKFAKANLKLMLE